MVLFNQVKPLVRLSFRYGNFAAIMADLTVACYTNAAIKYSKPAPLVWPLRYESALEAIEIKAHMSARDLRKDKYLHIDIY